MYITFNGIKHLLSFQWLHLFTGIIKVMSLIPLFTVNGILKLMVKQKVYALLTIK